MNFKNKKNKNKVKRIETNELKYILLVFEILQLQFKV